MRKIHCLITGLLLILFLLPVMLFPSMAAADSDHADFVVRKIEFVGLQRVARATALDYLPIKIGQTFKLAQSTKFIQTFYNTGFFTNIDLAHDGSTLIVTVQERPTISVIKIEGNKSIPQDKLQDALKKMGLETGRFLSHATLESVKQSLINQYYATGRYNVKVDVEQTPESLNRVAVHIQVSEGAIAKVASIKIIGNTVFSEKELVDQLTLSMPSFTTFFTRKDEYSDDKLQTSQEALNNYYLDHGYIRFKIDAAQVAITPDRKEVYLVLRITEGPQFTFSGYKLSGDLLTYNAQLNKAVGVKAGNIFSRQVILDTNRNMNTLLGDEGYAFAKIDPQPQVDNEKRTVFITFKVEPGRRYYVRYIRFLGNASTTQLALRDQLYEFEGSQFSGTQIRDSVYTLQQNTYLDQQQPPQITPKKVDTDNNQVDVDVKLTEKLAAELSFQVGYSQAYGFLVGASITQHNFMGTGKTVGVSTNVSSYSKSFNFSYSDPYYTPEGVSRTMSIYGQMNSTDQLQVISYNQNTYGANISFAFPLSLYSSLNLGYGLQHTDLSIGGAATRVVTNFTSLYGKTFDQLLLTAGWLRRTYDVPIFPRRGTKNELDLTLSAPIDTHPLQYYQISYENTWYQPLNDYFTFHTHGIASFGDRYGYMKYYPFFQNYYAGGLGVPGQNRAYYPFTLGPTDSKTGQPMGGNLLLSATASMIFPNFFHTPTVRTSVFLDGGNVFDTHYRGWNVSTGDLRYSYGTQLEWYTPLGAPLVFSLAFPIHSKPNDQLNMFQFSISTAF
jgi:outer membrane protein insertion porin family